MSDAAQKQKDPNAAGEGADQAELEAKDATIIGLQEQLEKAQQERDDADARADEAETKLENKVSDPDVKQTGPEAGKSVVRACDPPRLKLAEHRRRVFTITPAPETEFKDLLDEAYYKRIGELLKPMDQIEVVPERGDYFAILIVQASGKGYAHVATLLKKDLDPEIAAKRRAEYVVKWAGPVHKFRVTRSSDGMIMAHGYDTEIQALRAVKDM